jgi:NIMA (never in mitosis gene a)-related kinase 1/4/5
MFEKQINHNNFSFLSNILLNGNMLKLGDLGLSALQDSMKSTFSTKCGTESYMSPELLNNEKYSFNTDIWYLN